ncbi:MAG: PepSY domain-containing protein [Nanoarchaeota archaeon]
MTRTFEKMIIGIIFVVLIGFNSIFILGKQNDFIPVLSDASNAEKTATLVLQKDISEEQAKAIALSVVNGVITEIEEKTVNGVTFYEVEIDDGRLEIEIKIDKRNGDILQTTREEKDDNDASVSAEELKTIGGILTEEQAKAIALATVPGTVISVETERENGRLIYGFEIAAQNDVAEVEIDAETGEVLEIEWGDDDED